MINDKCNLNTVAHFETLFTNNDIAAIILPADTQAKSSASYCKVNLQSGCLQNCSKTDFITDPIATEMNDIKFRMAANSNKQIIRTISFDANYLWNLDLELTNWVSALPTNITKCRLYGGDIYNTDMLKSFIRVAIKFPEKQFYIPTCRVDILNEVEDIEIPHNLHLFGVYPNYSGLLRLNSFRTITINPNQTDLEIDLDVYPNSKTKDVEITLQPGNAGLLRTKRPLWKTILD